MTYLEARRIESLFKRYRQLAVDYWATTEPTNYTWMAGPNAPTHKDTDASGPIRQELELLSPEVHHWASKYGATVAGQSFPPASVGGPVIPYNLLSCVIDQWVGWSRVDRQDVLDAIDRCIGSARFVKRRILGRLLKPWCWLIDVPALIVGWPFAVMRKAGVPDKIVEGTGAQVIKAILTTLLWLATFAYAVYRTGLGAALQSALGGIS